MFHNITNQNSKQLLDSSLLHQEYKFLLLISSTVRFALVWADAPFPSSEHAHHCDSRIMTQKNETKAGISNQILMILGAEKGE